MANQSPTDDYFDGYRQGRSDVLRDLRSWVATGAMGFVVLLGVGLALLS